MRPCTTSKPSSIVRTKNGPSTREGNIHSTNKHAKQHNKENDERAHQSCARAGKAQHGQTKESEQKSAPDSEVGIKVCASFGTCVMRCLHHARLTQKAEAMRTIGERRMTEPYRWNEFWTKSPTGQPVSSGASWGLLFCCHAALSDAAVARCFLWTLELLSTRHRLAQSISHTMPLANPGGALSITFLTNAGPRQTPPLSKACSSTEKMMD